MRRVYPYVLIACISGLLFFHSLGKVSLFDWDEINFAESAREMIETNNYMRVQINYEPFWEKPPFFFWLQSASMHLFGVGETAARIPNAVCGIITLLILFAIGRRLHGEQMARWWVLVYIASFLPHLYFKSGIIDPWFNLLIFVSLYFLSRFISEVTNDRIRNRFLLLSAVFAGMGIITKGPVALLIILLTYLLFFFTYRKRIKVQLKEYLTWGVVMSLVTLLWFGLEIAQHGWWFVNEFITYQIRLAKTEDAGHGGFLLYHFVVLLIGCFPASVLMWGKSADQSERTQDQNYFRTMMNASLSVILIVFTLVQTKIVHYSSFAYLPIGYLAAVRIDQVVGGKGRFSRWQIVLFFVLGIIWSLAFIALPVIGNYPQLIRPLLSRDPFALANLQAEVTWGYLLIVPGILFLTAIVYGYLLLRKEKIQSGLLIIFLACILSMQSLLTLFAPRIEQYSQRAAIDFFKSLKNKNVYLGTIGYKSYAPFFYAEAGNNKGVIVKSGDWILENELDKPAYLVSKITEKERLVQSYSFLKVIYEKNGFVFYEKAAQP